MPAWEQGDLETLRVNAKHNLDILIPFVEKGSKVLVINPTCSMMMRREYTESAWMEKIGKGQKNFLKLSMIPLSIYGTFETKTGLILM